MKKIIKIILIIIPLVIGISFILNFYYPVKFQNKCNDPNLFHYKLGIYKIDTTIVDEIEYEKIGDFAEFLNLKKTKCLEEIEIENFTKIKEKIDSVNLSLGWKKLKCGLWRNKNGDLGFQTHRVVGMEGLVSVEDYITKFGFNENPPLKEIIDTLSFHELGNTYYKDKNHIYHSYAMTDGGSFYIFEEADYETFEILGDCYAKDKNHVYEMRAGIMEDVDHTTFVSSKGMSGCFAKDKNAYYSWDRKVEKEDLQDEHVRNAINELRNLNN